MIDSERWKKLSLAKKLKILRAERGISQTELEGLAGIGCISTIESGHVLNPGVVTIQKLAKALGVSVLELIDDT